jgi:hypothetical protein
MNSSEITAAVAIPTGHFHERISARCPECESRIRLQKLVAELLSKNQMLRIELQEARSQVASSDLGV